MKNIHKIIIPKEEPILIQSSIDGDVILGDKKETIEEAAERYVNFEYPIAHPRRVAKNAFINGAKFQQERSYSEEEVRKIAEEVRWQAIGNPLEFTKNFEKWFEQFKKK